jgi:hypothetical protein
LNIQSFNAEFSTAKNAFVKKKLSSNGTKDEIRIGYPSIESLAKTQEN